jgi:hypothetical protein
VSDMTRRELPPSFTLGPAQGKNIIGEITEALHRFLLDGWTEKTAPPRVEEDLSFVPKDREEVLYVYMYRAAQNTSLMNSKQWRPARINLRMNDPKTRTSFDQIYYERAPLYLNVHYMIGVHSKFRSDAERLLGWVLTRLYDATHLVYRPRKYFLPDGRIVDSMGSEWSLATFNEEVVMEKVGLSLVDDLTLGDAIHFYTIHEAPFRPYLTYRAQCSMEGPLVAGPPTLVRHQRAKLMAPEEDDGQRPNGRFSGSPELGNKSRMHIGPTGYGHRPIEEPPEGEPVEESGERPGNDDDNSSED